MVFTPDLSLDFTDVRDSRPMAPTGVCAALSADPNDADHTSLARAHGWQRKVCAATRTERPQMCQGNGGALPAEPRCAGAARRVVAEYADAHCVPDPPPADLTLAVSEAVTNSFMHAFRSEHVCRP